jgi:hypothetical protein
VIGYSTAFTTTIKGIFYVFSSSPASGRASLIPGRVSSASFAGFLAPMNIEGKRNDLRLRKLIMVINKYTQGVCVRNKETEQFYKERTLGNRISTRVAMGCFCASAKV